MIGQNTNHQFIVDIVMQLRESAKDLLMIMLMMELQVVKHMDIQEYLVQSMGQGMKLVVALDLAKMIKASDYSGVFIFL
ncbi:hypothetical protein LQE93_10710 [Clostridium sp. NSJ-145]|uniref:hypothetical protein n=1 Tax=Clostridium sp. NSJ-145 TaxID=2897777 RepID=UPI001E65C900|nr:hypothetical protein [Clostridium sp. NSJ-145]MCD2502249.1 hypothetical protein [Clostridium sp. NSJ-145]